MLLLTYNVPYIRDEEENGALTTHKALKYHPKKQAIRACHSNFTIAHGALEKGVQHHQNADWGGGAQGAR
jgi:hypothetical protein